MIKDEGKSTYDKRWMKKYKQLMVKDKVQVINV